MTPVADPTTGPGTGASVMGATQATRLVDGRAARTGAAVSVVLLTTGASRCLRRP